MANTGPHSAHSQFYVTMRALPSFDCKSVAFGWLIDGSRVLEFIGQLDTKMDRPVGNVAVCSCGKLAAVELGSYDEQAAAARLQAVHRSRLARKEAEEQACPPRFAAHPAGPIDPTRPSLVRPASTRAPYVPQAAAAAKMQAISKGRKTRKAMKETN